MAKDTHCSDKCCGADVKAEDCTCKPSCEHCNCNSVDESLRPSHAKELRNKELNKGKGAPKSGKTTGPDDYDFLKYKNKDKKKANEGLADMADITERDHEVQMARAELYKIAKYALKLHDMLKGVSEAEGIEGWMQSKITKAADYMGSVYHTMDYDMATESKVTHKNTMTEADASAYKNSLAERMSQKKSK